MKGKGVASQYEAGSFCFNGDSSPLAKCSKMMLINREGETSYE